MIKQFILFCLFTLLILSCKKVEKTDANIVVDKSIEVSGGELIKKSIIDFDFRNMHYRAVRNNGSFQYERHFLDSLNRIKDVLKNSGFQRFINDTYFAVSDEKEQAYSSSVNSVHYFSVLPYGLNAAAVNKTYLEDVKIKGRDYHKIKVTFNQEGGGEDFEDVFIYFIDIDTFKVGYLAYSYNENDGVGLRFREAFNERYINGIRFVDYNNYKPKSKNEELENLDNLFEAGNLDLLSKIELKNIKVLF